MTPLIEDVSRHAVQAFYLAAFVMGLIAHWHTRLWARKASTVAIMVAAAGWLYFYTYVANAELSTAPDIVLQSRIFHYNTATMLFIAAFLMRRADRYGVGVALSRGQHE